MSDLEVRYASALERVAARHQASARNLLHYLAMRRTDLRALQHALARLGLSSLGRAEAHALSTVLATLHAVRRLTTDTPSKTAARAPCDMPSGSELLASNTRALFGAPPGDRSAHIMVTMGSEAAGDSMVVHRLLEAGMTCMRINCAHDNAEAWSRMIEHLRKATAALNRPCTILMDLGGPKLRTGPIAASAAVKKVKPQRDAYGRVVAPVRLWLTGRHSRARPPTDADATLHVSQRWLEGLKPGDRAVFHDTRGRRRTLHIVERCAHGVWGELRRTAYLTNGLRLECRGKGRPRVKTTLSGIEKRPGYIPLQSGDLLLLVRDQQPGCASFDSAGRLLSPARVSCTLPQVFQDVVVGARICLDDGRVTGVVEAVSESELSVRITRTPPRGARLKDDKGINLPDSELRLPALTAKDHEDLKFIARHADMVGLSFANRESDVLSLIEALGQSGEQRPGIILKIETQRGFKALPAMLLTAMRYERVGVMIARGDLAVECGYERLAEAQEEILWICEAAHCSTIWATQVLETLAKEGIPSRAEITDAAMGNRAECVMLNKGPHIHQALIVLGDILRRMDTHQAKKSAMLRALQLAAEFDLSVA
jgi:pyruvate kinase